MMIVFSVLSLLLMAQIVLTYVFGWFCKNPNPDVAWFFAFTAILVNERNSYKAFKRQETLCQAIVYLSRQK